MLDNILIGPVLSYNNEEHYKQIVEEIAHVGWFPFYKFTQGELFEKLKATLPEADKALTTGMLTTYGFVKPYYA